ncbi:MAG: hypothetical protein P9L92_05370 [Candidatus Electryonea clarkiae]|nr:hypothetical protein [Candidatus Electryonea clarkiae]
MDDQEKKQLPQSEEEKSWEPPKILEQGRIEALLFSDEPDPWGP